MNSPARYSAGAFVVVCLTAFSVFASNPLERVPNTTLQMPATPPVFGYTSENAFGSLVFSNAVGMATPPGETNRLFVIGKNGLIHVITNLASPNRTLFMDMSSRGLISTISNSGGNGEQGLLGMAFHPGYATNRYFYLFYTGTNALTGTTRHDILSRFQTSAVNPNQGDVNSEVYLFAQLDESPNHNGGDIKFGPDGYLYVPLGDEGAGNDTHNNSQTITKDFFSGVLRIDVDKLPGNLPPNAHTSLLGQTNYFVPSDNPFVGATSFNGSSVNPNQVRTEFWAVGLRNPWRMNFDPLTGALYLGDVGQDAGSGWEEINIITKGANYGWAYMHGTAPGPKSAQAPPGFTQTAPLYAYQTSASFGRVIIGGVRYRGNRLSQLSGAYVYADANSGTVWALRHEGSTIITNETLFTDPGISSFGVDPRNGDVLYAIFQGTAPNSIIKRINYNAVGGGTPLPPTLADTGAFSDTAALTPSAGVVPYDINVPFWSDNAIKSRWFSVPNTNLTIGFHPTDNWSFPTGTVWVKHFDLELTNGVPESKKRLETRLLVRNAGGVYGVTYRWGDSLTNATLVPEEGLNELFVIDDGGGITRTQEWRYPSRAECITCHTPAGGLAIGFNTPQINHVHDYDGIVTNQILALSAAGYFNTNVTEVDNLIALAKADDPEASLEFRSRSYFTANCVQCHQPAGNVAAAEWDARITTPIGQAGLINATPFNNLGDPANRVIKPAAPTNSTLYRRIAEFSPFHMPPLATSVINTQAVALLEDWILSLTNNFWLNPVPTSRNVTLGNNTQFQIGFNPTDDFIDPVTLTVEGVPANTTADFTPAVVTDPTNSVLTITTSNDTPIGTYELTITGTSAGITNTTSVTLIVSLLPPPAPGTLVWNNSAGSQLWSAALNWTNTTAGGYGPPSPSNSVAFLNTATAGSIATINNTVDENLSGPATRVQSLSFSHTTGFHHTHIASGITLALSNTAAGNALFVGTGVDSGSNQTVTAAISGAAGTLTMENSSANISVRQGGAAGTHQATLDLSGLATFDATVARLLVAGDGGSALADNRLSGVLYLARTNNLNIVGGSASAPALNIGDHPSNGRGNPQITLLPSYLFLGIENTVAVNTLTVGRQKAAPVSMLFNPAFLTDNPTATFRGTGGIGSRVTTWSIGDNSAQATSNQGTEGTNDFRGGHVDALVATMYVGRGELGGGNLAGTGTGTLSFDQGIIDVNVLEAGFQSQAGSASAGIGRVNVSGTALLVVNDTLRLAQYNTGTGVSQGTLNVTNGTVRANTIVAGGGTSAVNIQGGTLAVTNSAGTPAVPVTTITLNNSTLPVRLNASSIRTNLIAGTLNVAGVNTVNIESAVNITESTVFPIARYNVLNGSAAGFAVDTVPQGFLAEIVANPGQNRIDLHVTPVPPKIPRINTVTFMPPFLILSGTNGPADSDYHVLTSTNIEVPLSNWTSIATNLFNSQGDFTFTNAIDPEVPQQFYLLQLP